MKKFLFLYIIATMSLISQPVYAQSDTASLGLPGDNLDLYAVLNLFQKSKTIEDFEKSLNEEKTGINNMDLNLDGKVDFIKVITNKKDSSFTFVLQIAVSKEENQDVAVILLDKDKKGKISLQIVGDEKLYGKDYVVEPADNTTSKSVTANPAYQGPDPVVVTVPAPTTTVVVQSAPIVQYVYSPAYVPYYPPYYYGYYPPYFAAFTVAAVAIYRHNNYYHHHGYHGGHYHGGNTVVINNRNNYNNYNNNNRNRSNTVNNNMAGGKYDNNVGNRGNSNRGPSASTRPANSGPSASTRPSTGNNPSQRLSPTTSDRAASGGASASNRQSNLSSSNRSSSGSSYSRPSTSNYSPSSGRSRSSGGGGFSGGTRGGGGGRRR